MNTNKSLHILYTLTALRFLLPFVFISFMLFLDFDCLLETFVCLPSSLLLIRISAFLSNFLYYVGVAVAILVLAGWLCVFVFALSGIWFPKCKKVSCTILTVISSLDVVVSLLAAISRSWYTVFLAILSTLYSALVLFFSIKSFCAIKSPKENEFENTSKTAMI